MDGDGAIAEVAVLLGGHHVAYGDPVVLIGVGEHIVGSAGAIQNGKGRYGEVPEVRRLATAVQVQTLVIGDIALGGAERGIPVGGVPIQDALTIHGVSIAHMGDAPARPAYGWWR